MNRAIASATSRSRAAIPIRCANGATWASTNAAASRRQHERGFGDPAGPPGLQVTGLHPGPDPGEAVLQLHRRRDQPPAGVGGPADRERELRDAELRHQRRPLTRRREAGVAGGGDPGGCLADRLRWVLLGPGHRGEQHIAPAPGRRGPGRSRANPQHLSRGVELPEVGAGGRCHDPIQAATTDRNRSEFPAVEGNSRVSLVCARGGSGRAVRRTVPGLVCPLASLAARPPVVAVLPRRYGELVSSVRSLRSLLDHPSLAVVVCRPACRSRVIVWGRVHRASAVRRLALRRCGRRVRCLSSDSPARRSRSPVRSRR